MTKRMIKRQKTYQRAKEMFKLYLPSKGHGDPYYDTCLKISARSSAPYRSPSETEIFMPIDKMVDIAKFILKYVEGEK